MGENINLCSGCKITCCDKFVLDDEAFDPRGYRQTLDTYPFIHQYPGLVTIRIYGQDVRLHRHRCDRYDPVTGNCVDYYIQERPSFCIATGIRKKPHTDCLLPTPNKPY